VIYFSGFSLSGEQAMFDEYLVDSDMTVAGFSSGAIEAMEYTLETKQRVDRLILLSPAFFQTQKPSFVRTQLRYFASSKEAYIEKFLQNVTYPAEQSLAPYLCVGSRDELERLLTYRWDTQKLQQLLDRGITIEVFLGGKDRIMDADSAYDLFSPLTTTYLIKSAGHMLLSNSL